jgi:hypothetical protein
MRSESEILEYYLPLVTEKESEVYLRIHAKRFAYLLNFILGEVGAKDGSGMKIMDIGPSFFTDILSKNLPEAEIHTMGFVHPESRGGHLPEFIELSPERFHQFDLNLTEHKTQWVHPPEMDLVVMGEVLEHLHTSPVHVFSFVRSFLSEKGKYIVGTPNAAALEKRFALLMGKNPYELIRLDKDNPGHFREYTVEELRRMGREANLELIGHETLNYFSRSTGKGKLFDAFTNFLPPTFRTGINAVFVKR